MKFTKCLLICMFCLVFSQAFAETIHYEAKDGLVTYRADVYDPGRTELPILEARYRFYDEQTVAHTILGDSAYDISENITYKDGSNSIIFVSKSGKLRLSDHERISYDTKASDSISEVLNQETELYCRDTLPSYDLNFMSRNEAAKKCLEIFNALNLDCQIEAVYAIDKTTYDNAYAEFKAYEDSLSSENNFSSDDEINHGTQLPTITDWPYDDIGYVVFLRQQYDGIPFYNGSYNLATSRQCATGPDINATYGQDGLLRLEVDVPFQITGMQQPSKIITWQEAVQCYSDSQNMILAEGLDESLITRITLEYIPASSPSDDGVPVDEPFTLRPAWIFEWRAPDDEEMVSHYVVDALNGDVMDTW